MEAACYRPLGTIYVYYGAGTGVRRQGLAGDLALAPILRTEGKVCRGIFPFRPEGLEWVWVVSRPFQAAVFLSMTESREIACYPHHPDDNGKQARIALQ